MWLSQIRQSDGTSSHNCSQHGACMYMLANSLHSCTGACSCFDKAVRHITDALPSQAHQFGVHNVIQGAVGRGICSSP